MTSGRARLGFLALAILLAIAPRAQAQTDPNKQEAKLHYEKATRLYDVGKYGESIQEYEAAYLLVEDPALLYNIGQAYRLWDKPEEAVRAYKNYLRKRPDAPNRADVEKRIAELERVVEERRRALTPPAPPSPAPSVTPAPVAPEPVAAAPAGPVSPAPSPATAPAAAPGPSSSPAPQPVAITSAAPAPTGRTSGTRIVPYAFLGTGGAALLTSAVAGLYARSQAQKIVNESKKDGTYNPDWQSRGRVANTVAIVSGISGLVLAGTGLYLLWTAAPSSRTTSISQSRTALFPVAGPGYAGAAALVNF